MVDIVSLRQDTLPSKLCLHPILVSSPYPSLSCGSSSWSLCIYIHVPPTTQSIIYDAALSLPPLPELQSSFPQYMLVSSPCKLHDLCRFSS